MSDCRAAGLNPPNPEGASQCATKPVKIAQFVFGRWRSWIALLYLVASESASPFGGALPRRVGIDQVGVAFLPVLYEGGRYGGPR